MIEFSEFTMAPRYTAEEKKILKELGSSKNCTWNDLADKFNARTGGSRSSSGLSQKFRSMQNGKQKQIIKNYASKQKHILEGSSSSYVSRASSPPRQTYYEPSICTLPPRTGTFRMPPSEPLQPPIIQILNTNSEDKEDMKKRLDKVEGDLTSMKDQLQEVTKQLTNIAKLSMEMKQLLSRKNKSLEKKLKVKDAVLSTSMRLNKQLGNIACESSDESDCASSIVSSKFEEE